eukprot:Skav216508  [mRNA]  locus=scaffold1123:670197:673678:- [translate_table: standard]
MSQILTALLDSQDDRESYATTQCDSTQVDQVEVDSPGSVKFPEIDVCSTEEDVDTTASESEVSEGDFTEGFTPGALAIGSCLRHLVALEMQQSLHPPPPRIFPRQAEAICCLEALVSSGRYKPHQVGLFSREFTTTGCRSFLVDTHAGFALTASPQDSWLKSSRAAGCCGLGPRHLYEVLLENKPCWLYFDLEFSRVENPDLEPGAVASAFLELLNEFCDVNFGHVIDPAALYDLDSTNAEKFSKHIIVKKLQSNASSCTLAFPNNAQAGYFVKLFMDWVRKQRKAGSSLARQLFAIAKPKKGKEPTAEKDWVPVVDESVFGKKRPLLPTWSGQPPALQLLESLASFVPEGTTLFRPVPVQYLIELWDDCRQKNEPNGTWGAAPTRVQKSLLLGDYMVVALTNNRFCFNKGAPQLQMDANGV